ISGTRSINMLLQCRAVPRSVHTGEAPKRQCVSDPDSAPDIPAPHRATENFAAGIKPWDDFAESVYRTAEIVDFEPRVTRHDRRSADLDCIKGSRSDGIDPLCLLEVLRILAFIGVFVVTRHGGSECT